MRPDGEAARHGDVVEAEEDGGAESKGGEGRRRGGGGVGGKLPSHHVAFSAYVKQIAALALATSAIMFCPTETGLE